MEIFEYINNFFNNFTESIELWGIWGVVGFIIIYIIATIFLIPGSALTLGAGLIFGILKGSILVSIASVTGATLSFLIGRYFLRSWVEKQIETQPKFTSIDRAVAKEGWKIVGLTRLSPLFPFVFLNYAFGVTKVSLKDYFFASWIGMLPGTIMYVYIGSIPKTALEATTGNTDTLRLILNIIGFIATVAVTIYITRIAKKALDDQQN
ncbi:TVP38/TMEM64 family protein [Geminocystis herdmanii]|uniref:TVP38/TMEM64 family protein n=1 Tax=Geminocystis herdmanii TaxID=669359 RepID=UPI00034547B0|nr:TVP38/TMEM64 family protein [Geminocystis herdmanii]